MAARRLILPVEFSYVLGREEHLFPGSGLVIANGEGLKVLREEARELRKGHTPREAYLEAPEWANAILSGKEKGKIHYLRVEDWLVQRFEVHIESFWEKFNGKRYNPNEDLANVNPDYDGCALG